MSSLDCILLSESNQENIKKEFELYKLAKTDDLCEPPIIKMPLGVDGVTCEHFLSDFENRTLGIHKRISKGKYKFKPFREEIKSKDAKIKSKVLAMELNKYRILSIACIDDVLTQKIIYKILSRFTEDTVFKETNDLSYAYRPNKSAPQAAKKLYEYMKDGYLYALDADIEKFFDKIPHNELMSNVVNLLGENKLLIKYIKRFIKAPRVEYNTYNGNATLFQSKIPQITKRLAGVPQGGILSGLLANIYLHQFDMWIKSDLNNRFDVKYVRYADDFVILCKSEESIIGIRTEVAKFLRSIKLSLHPDEKKTKIVNLTRKKSAVEFVGFSISPTGIRIKTANLLRFKSRIKELIYDDITLDKNFRKGIHRINYKVIGNELANRYCINCGLREPRRSWLDYFVTLTDIQQLKSLDLFIRTEIYKYTKFRYKINLSKNDLILYGLFSLEKTYYRFRKEIMSPQSYCSCSTENKSFKRIKSSRYVSYLTLHDY
ncbi:reverse transcriptase domain-containing protein [Paenibacillus alba]|uniref:Reverse transcriptase domain-containing protein n=1 Tax=Paenibacillus alba TaxID=1197127 RepID=A0ABU6GD61_9BACL|nr:reverse transcriptase domain-containing protein [Paenibacillus alba]MEC0232145.1 reverse transcriptase domain-containing protein [Paenibacillus alba]